MRPKAFRKATDEVYKALWTHPDHELVEWVRKQVLEANGDLATDVLTGRLLDARTLASILDESESQTVLRLAAVLWATRFEGPDAEALFRILVARLAPAISRPKAAASAPARSEVEVKSLKAQLRALKKDLRQAEAAATRAQKALRPKERAYAQLRQELGETQRSYENAIEQKDRLEEDLRQSEAEINRLTRSTENDQHIKNALRRDLSQLQQDLRTLGIERSDLARKLGGARRTIEQLNLLLESVPRGIEAAWEFLKAEEERIQRDRRILQGGSKARADEAWTAHRKLEAAFLEAYPQYRQPRPVTIRPKSALRLVALGGADEVGRSCYLLQLGERRILVDCGIKPGDSEDLHPDLERLDRIDGLVLTHAHTDHIGWVPALVHKFGEFDIYCTDGTAALLPIMLSDCRRHYARAMARKREYARYSKSPSVIEDAYEEEDLQVVPNLAVTCEIGKTERLPFGDVSVCFYDAGHILGAASVLIEDQTGRKIFFSGDFSSFEQATVPAASWPGPDDLDEIDLLVLESTYGNRTHSSLAESREDFVRFVRETLERNGSVIVASFALGRAQELIKLMLAAREREDIPSTSPLYVDGMIKEINPIYRRFGALGYGAADFEEVSGQAQRRDVVLAAQRHPSVIVTTSGMLTGGPVVEYAQHLLPDPRHRLVLVGYQDEGAPSKALRDVSKGPCRVSITDENGDVVEFEAARPAKHVGLSSHADQPGLLQYASRLRPKHIALVHGDPAAQEELRSQLLDVHPRADVTCGPSELDVP